MITGRGCLCIVNMTITGSFSALLRQIFLKSTKDSCKNFASQGKKILRLWPHCQHTDTPLSLGDLFTLGIFIVDLIYLVWSMKKK